jgi:hypothetical protein
MLPDNIVLKRIIPIREAATLMGCCEDTARKKLADKIVHVGKRRIGVRVEDALLLAKEKAA